MNRDRLLLPLLCALTIGACAHGTGGKADPGTAPPTATAPVARRFRLVDGLTGAALADSAFGERIRAARAIFVGEQHDNPGHHFVQITVLQRVFAEDASLGFGFEMLPHNLQGALTDFVSGRSDEATFLRAVDWEKTWGYPFGFYRPLLLLCREHGLPAFALNAPRGLSRALSKKGIDGLTADERMALPEMVPGPEAHREFVRQAFGAHAVSRFTDQKFERFYRAQLLWDETMAQNLSQALRGDQAPHRIVMVAGEGHTRRWAVPDRAARRGVTPDLLILASEEKDLADALFEHAADVFFVFTDKAP